MKKLPLVVAATFTLFSFSAVAGGNCLYGNDAKISKAEDNGVLYDKDLVDPSLLALLKKQQGQQHTIKPLPTFN